jgi:hypothetical protein
MATNDLSGLREPSQQYFGTTIEHGALVTIDVIVKEQLCERGKNQNSYAENLQQRAKCICLAF